MICLTGDVHHASLRTNESRFIASGDSEVRIAQRYVELIEKYGVKTTLYICGKCFIEEWDDLRPVVSSSVVDIGGHGYSPRHPRPLFDWYGRHTGNWNGPKLVQARDIRKNISACEDRCGRGIAAWRAHSYKVDPNTYPLMRKYGVQVVSDAIDPQNLLPVETPDGLISHPINVIPDHDHLYHAHRTREFVERANRRGYGADGFGAVSYDIEEWGDLVLRQARNIEEQGGVATILAHPICMYISDGFTTLERLLKEFSGLACIWASEIPETMDRNKNRESKDT